MDLTILAHLSGVPFLGAAVHLLYNASPPSFSNPNISNRVLYQQQCTDLSGRCLSLMVALQEGSQGLEGSRVTEIADEIEAIIFRINRKVKEWGSWNHLKSLLAQGEIKDGIDRLHRDIDAAMMKFNVQINMEMSRGQLETKAIQARDKAEIRDLLQHIVRSTEDMRTLMTMSSRDSRPVEVMMESLQTELMDPSLEKTEGELPPLTDLSGQVTLSSQNTVAKGSFNDIFLGQWLDREPVALRLPRALANNPEVQRRFQREVSIWRELNNPNIVPLYGVIYIGEDLYQVTPWMDNGTAVTYVKKFPTADRLKLLIEVASGLRYLHQRGIVHGDLRGCGKGMTTTNNINPRWFAPELLQQHGHVSTHSDVWSFGMVCLELLSGEVPFSSIPRDIAVLRELDNGKLPKHPGRSATGAGSKCWQRKPESRPSIEEIKKSLMVLKGLASPKIPLTARLSRFSIRQSGSRPNISMRSDGRLAAALSAPETYEKDELSPLGINIGFWTTLPESTIVLGFDQSSSSAAPKVHHRTTSYSSSVGPNLEVPPLSSSLPLKRGILPRCTVCIIRWQRLVQRLITNFNSRKDSEYRDILLTACADFTTPEDLFGILSRRFYDAEMDSSVHPEDRVALQYNVFMVITYWLSNRHLVVDHQLLWQMKTFCESAIRMKSSTTMSDKARDLLQMIENRAHQDIPSSPLSPGRRMLKASEIKPRDLAIALTLLEGDKYKVLVPSDYIAHLRRHPGYNNVQGAYTINNKIVFWVKDSILHYDRVDQRADVLKFFIHTAQECRKLRNFSSVVAIASALHSDPIERLKLTKSAMTFQMQGKLEALEDIINPTANHRGYRNAVNDTLSIDERDHCIPWLPVHLKELNMVLSRYPITVQVDGRPLINFQRYIKFMDRIKEVVHYKPPSLEQYRQQGQLDYLENQLRNLKMTSTSDDDLMTRSRLLEAREIQDYKTRKPQLKSLGFKT
ncbi:ras guanine nucleotide exchange factor domain-containing protein [Pholiota molesta]|nr:ras guanine nucleotide exchange factor domain-containing protein [Pholiota molesta]